MTHRMVLRGLGQAVRDPKWSDVVAALERLKDTAGSVQIDIIDPAEPGPRGLQVFHENGNYIVMLAELYEDHNVRTFDNPEMPLRQISILGDYWDSRSVSQNFNLVRAAFQEFFEKGDVTRDLLK